MHKLPQPVKLWYLSSFFRRERPQKGRFRQFWQVGAEAIGSDDPAVDAEMILLLGRAARGARRARRAAAARPASASRRRARPTARSCRRTCARTRTELSRGGRRRGSTSTRCARSTPTTRRTQRVMADAPRLIDRLAAGGPRALRRGPGPARRRRPGLRRSTRRSCAGSTTTRARCSSSPPTRSAAQSTRRRRRPLRRAGRADRRPADARAWAGRRASSGCCWPRRSRRRSQPPLDLYVAYAARAARGRLPARRRRAPRRATRQDSNSPAAASRASSSRPTARGARYVAIFGDEGVQLRDMRERRGASSSRPTPSCTTSAGPHVRPPRANPYRDAWAGELDAARVGERRARGRLGAPPARPRRADLHRPARPLRASSSSSSIPRPRPSARAGRAAAPRARRSAPPGEVVRREEGNVNPNLATGEIELDGHATPSTSPRPRRRRSRSTRTARWTR